LRRAGEGQELRHLPRAGVWDRRGTCKMKRYMDEIYDLEHRLTIARERLQRAISALAPKHKGGEWEEQPNRRFLNSNASWRLHKGRSTLKPWSSPFGGTPALPCLTS